MKGKDDYSVYESDIYHYPKTYTGEMIICGARST